MGDFKTPKWHVELEDEVEVQKLARVFLLACHNLVEAFRVEVVQDLLLLAQVVDLFTGVVLLHWASARLCSVCGCRLRSV